MDYFKYQIELDKISKDITSKYLKNKRSNYKKAKSWLIGSFKNDKYKDLSGSVPFFSPYFRNNFIFFCRQAPDFVGSVFHSYIYLTSSDVKIFLETLGKRHLNLVNEEDYIAAENSYKDTRKILFDILESPKILKTDVKNVLTLFDLFSKEFYYEKAQYLYVRLFQEIIFSLQLLNNIEDLNKLVYPHHGFIGNGPKLLARFDKLKKKKNHTYTFISILFEDLERIYNRIEELRIEKEKSDTSKKQGTVSMKNPFSDLKIKMIPNLDDNFKNEVIINNEIVIEMDNSRFDLLYYLLWLRRYHTNTVAEIRSDGSIEPDIINEMTNNDSRIDRFGWTWNKHAMPSRVINEKSKQVGKINEEFKIYTNLDKPIIIKNPSLYILASEIRTENIEMVSFQKNS